MPASDLEWGCDVFPSRAELHPVLGHGNNAQPRLWAVMTDDGTEYKAPGGTETQ